MRAISCGVDLIEISRIKRALERRRFRERIFTAQERAQLHSKQPQSWAGRFAAKEAVMKALGTGWSQGVGFDQIEVVTLDSGRPVVNLHGRALEVSRALGVSDLLVSISHSRDYAIAMVVAVGEE